MRLASFLIAALLAAVAPATWSAPAACVAHSGAHRTHLVELYTSEGCSSCPPADRWLRGIRADEAVVPLELHVDYWDSLGWRDPFADHRFTARQYAMAARSGQRSVYTPEVAFDGHEWRGWNRSGPFTAGGTPAFTLRLDVHPGATPSARLHAQAAAGVDVSDYRAFLAVTENGLASRVVRGENAGRELRHAHTVRFFAGPLPLDRASATLVLPAGLVPAHAAVVGFVQNRRTGDIDQVVRLPLKSCMTAAPLP